VTLKPLPLGQPSVADLRGGMVRGDDVVSYTRLIWQPAPSLLGSFLKTVHTCVAHHNASCLAAHRTQIQGPASGLLWLEVARMDTCVSPLWSGLSHELTVMLLPPAWVPNQTLRQGEAQHAGMLGSRLCSGGGLELVRLGHMPSLPLARL